MELDLVIPLYNASANIERLTKVLNQWHTNSIFELRVIFVEDGGQSCHQELVNLCPTFEFRFIRLAKNYGQHTATAIGLSQSKAQIIATMDDDLQHLPQDIERLYQHMVEHDHDLVYGYFENKKHSFIRNAGTKLLQLTLSNAQLSYANVTSFRLMKSNVANAFKNLNSPIIFIEEYLLRASNNRGSLALNHYEREAGSSNYNYLKLLNFAIRIVVFHSSFPIKAIVRIGLIISLVCFIAVCYFLYNSFMYGYQLGYASLIVSIFFSTGILLMTLGVIAEYVRRIWVQNHFSESIIFEALEKED